VSAHLRLRADKRRHGVHGCEPILGASLAGGGAHPLMGTHNRLLRIATERFPRAYLEVIAIDPDAPPPDSPRWFDLDDPALHHAVRQQPRLVHFVARSDQAAGAVKALHALGIERGPLVHAERPTSNGVLQWQISIRPDGQRLFYGALPTLIQWSNAHPADSMPESGVTLLSLQVRHPRAEPLDAAHRAIGLQQVQVARGAPNLVATLATPKGVVSLESAGT